MNPQKGLLQITRRKEYFGLIRGLVVRINGEKVASIASGDTFEIELSPAEYSVQVRMDWCSSQAFVFQIDAGQIIHLESSLNGGTFGAMFNTYLNWNNLFLLNPIGLKSKRKNDSL